MFKASVKTISGSIAPSAAALQRSISVAEIAAPAVNPLARPMMT
jgi:hypothetical protein